MTQCRGLRVLGLEECLERLRSTPVGRLAFMNEGEPVVVPVDHAVDGVDVVFRTSWSSKRRARKFSAGSSQPYHIRRSLLGCPRRLQDPAPL